MAEKKKKSQVSLGVLFWIAFILLVLVIFLLNRPTITKLVRKFSSAVQGTEQPDGAPAPVHEIPAMSPLPEREPEPVQPLPAAPDSVLEEPSPEPDVLPPESAEPPAGSQPPSGSQPSVSQPPSGSQPPAADTAAGTPSAAKPEPEQPQPPAATRSAVLYFVRIESNGTIARKKVVRSLPKSNSPLVDTINALLEGPDTPETDGGAVTLIPSGTRLLSATVKNGTAVLNFNDTFQFSEYGIEGAIGQLMQIVFTATEFSTVSNVQFLIEGQRKEYLGADGIKIGVPFSRTSFN